MKELTSNQEIAASWLLMCISRNSKKMWDGLAERHHQMLSEWQKFNSQSADSDKIARLLFWSEEGGSSMSYLHVIESATWTTYKNDDSRQAVSQFLPATSPEWTIEEEKNASPDWPFDIDES